MRSPSGHSVNSLWSAPGPLTPHIRCHTGPDNVTRDKRDMVILSDLHAEAKGQIC